MALEVCRGSRFRGAFTTRVLLETRVNIAGKFGETELLRFYHQLAAVGPEMVAPPSHQEVVRCSPLTGVKDAHVLAAALECGADYLLTLDRRHLLTPTAESAVIPLKVITPGQFHQELVSPDP